MTFMHIKARLHCLVPPRCFPSLETNDVQKPPVRSCASHCPRQSEPSFILRTGQASTMKPVPGSNNTDRCPDLYFVATPDFVLCDPKLHLKRFGSGKLLRGLLLGTIAVYATGHSRLARVFVAEQRPRRKDRIPSFPGFPSPVLLSPDAKSLAIEFRGT